MADALQKLNAYISTSSYSRDFDWSDLPYFLQFGFGVIVARTLTHILWTVLFKYIRRPQYFIEKTFEKQQQFCWLLTDASTHVLLISYGFNLFANPICGEDDSFLA